MLQLHTPRRFGTGLFIVLAHFALIAALLQHANRPKLEDTGPVEYMSYIVVPKPPIPRVEERAASITPPPMRRSRPPAVASVAQPAITIVPAVEPAAVQAPVQDAAPSASPSPKLDMAALRADAHRASKDYVPRNRLNRYAPPKAGSRPRRRTWAAPSPTRSGRPVPRSTAAARS